MISTKKMYFVNAIIAWLPVTACMSWKRRLYRWAGVVVGNDVEIFRGVRVEGCGMLEIHDRAFIGHEVLFMLNEGSRVVVEESAIIGTRSVVMTGFHPITPQGDRILSREGTTSEVRIGKGSSVLTGSMVLPGVQIGEKALVAAGAVVAKDVQPYTLVGGCPARWIKDLRPDNDK